MIRPEVGKTYATRSGHKVVILNDISGILNDDGYPLRANIYAPNGELDRLAFYTYSGRYRKDGESQFDLVVEVQPCPASTS